MNWPSYPAIGGGISLIAITYLSLTVGVIPLSLQTALFNPDSVDAIILWELRLPRTGLALLSGAGLSVAGAVLQQIFHNPLAEPHMMGISSCASLGSVVCLYGGIAGISPVMVSVGGMMGAFVGSMILGILFVRGGIHQISGLLLAGIALSVMANMLMTLVMTFAASPYALMDMMFWLLGSLENRTGEHFMIAVLPLVGGLLLLLSLKRELRALALGDETAQTLGVSLRRLWGKAMLGIALIVGASVSVMGMIGFIGLIVPHSVRSWKGYDPEKNMGWVALMGAILLMVADIAVRLMPFERPLNVGVMMSLIGIPFFIRILWVNRTL